VKSFASGKKREGVLIPSKRGGRSKEGGVEGKKDFLWEIPCVKEGRRNSFNISAKRAN